MKRLVAPAHLILVLFVVGGAVWTLMHRRSLDPESIELSVRMLGICAPVGFVALYALGLTGISPRAYIVTSAVCMLPGAIAYTWLGYAGRSAIAGDTSALRYGLLGLGVLAMIAFLPRLFRRLRARTPVWIDTAEALQAAGLRDVAGFVAVRMDGINKVWRWNGAA